MTDKRVPECGDVYYVNFRGNYSVQNGWRPAIIFQNLAANTFSPNVIVIPLTSNLKRMDMPTHVAIPSERTGLPCDSMAICETPQCISKEDVGNYITRLPKRYMREVAIAHLVATSALSYLDRESIMEARKITKVANGVMA